MTTDDTGSKLALLASQLARNLIKQRGAVIPDFGLGLDREAQLVWFTKTRDGLIPTIEGMPELMREDARSGRLIASAIVGICRAAPSASALPRDVIAIQVEVPGKAPTVFAHTFKIGFFGGCKLGDSFIIARPIAGSVFA